jgi:hypothetical protein
MNRLERFKEENRFSNFTSIACMINQICYKYTEDWIVMPFARDPITANKP